MLDSHACRLIGLFYRCFYQHTNSPSLLRLYKSFIRPHLDYSCIVWNPHLKGELNLLKMYKSLPFEFV